MHQFTVYVIIHYYKYNYVIKYNMQTYLSYLIFYYTSKLS